MNREFIDLAKKATDENWDAFKIMAEFMSLQKEVDARIADLMNQPEVSTAIRQQ